MTILELFLAAVVLALAVVLYLQRGDIQKKMRRLHANISYSAQVIEMEIGSVNISRSALGVAAKLLRASTRTTRQFVSGESPAITVSPMLSSFARNAIVGAVIPIDCRIVEPCDWENGIVRAVVEFPAKLHERDAHIMHLSLDRFHKNPVVLDPSDFGQSIPIGSAVAEPSDGSGIALKIKLAIDTTSRAAQMRDELKSGKFAICAYVRLSDVTDDSDRPLYKGELVALQPFLNRTEPSGVDGEAK